MTEDNLVCCSGRFPFVQCHDSFTLSEGTITEKATINSDGIGCRENVRITRVRLFDSSRRLIAVSGCVRPYPVLVYDLDSDEQLANCLGHQNHIWGLASLPSTLSSVHAKIISGGSYGDRQLLVFDAMEGSLICKLSPSLSTSRILHVPEWDSGNVFVGGRQSLFRYDLDKERLVGSYGALTGFNVNGLSPGISLNFLFSASDGKSVQVWSRDQFECCIAEEKLSGRAQSCHFVESAQLLLVGLDNGMVEVHDLRRTNVPVRTITVASTGWVYDISELDDEDRFACACGNSLVVCEVTAGQVFSKAALPSDVYGVCYFGKRSDVLVQVVPTTTEDITTPPVEEDELEGVDSSSSDAVGKQAKQIHALLENKQRQLDELRHAMRDKETVFRQVNETREREFVELRRFLEAKERECEEVRRALRQTESRHAREMKRELRRIVKERELESEELHRATERTQRALQKREKELLRARQRAQEKQAELERVVDENEAKRQLAVEEKDREFAELRRTADQLQVALQEKEMEAQQALAENMAELSGLRAMLQTKEDKLSLVMSRLQQDGLSSRTREFLHRLDSQTRSFLDLSEKYLRRGCIDFHERIIGEEGIHLLSSQKTSEAAGRRNRRFVFRDVWYGHTNQEKDGEGEAFVPFDCPEQEQEDEEGVVSIVETVVIDMFRDSLLVELFEQIDEGSSLRDEITTLQRKWNRFYRVDAVELASTSLKVMNACEDATRRAVSSIVSQTFDFFGGSLDAEKEEGEGVVRRRYEEERKGDLLLLGELKSFGLGRHRSLCFKLACDRLGIPCRLIRGWREGYRGRFADAWCIVNLCDRLLYVDLVEIGCLVEEFDGVLLGNKKAISESEECPTLSVKVDRLADNYESLSKDSLGHGQVFAVEFENIFLAVKEVNLTKREEDEEGISSSSSVLANARIRRELNLLLNLSHHRNIVPVCGHFECVRQIPVLSRSRTRSRRSRRRRMKGIDEEEMMQQDTIVGIVMPLYDHNAKVLRKILLRVDSSVALRETLILLLSIANGLHYLHSLSMLHLALKPSNVLVSMNEDNISLSDVRICDFVGSRQSLSVSVSRVVGVFTSPEVTQVARRGEDEDAVVVDEASDMFSFGALMRFYSCFFGSFRQLYELCDRCLLENRVSRPSLMEAMHVLRSHLLLVDGRLMKSGSRRRRRRRSKPDEGEDLPSSSGSD